MEPHSTNPISRRWPPISAQLQIHHINPGRLYMHKGSVLFLMVFALECRPQVLAPPEILDPPLRALQQKHFSELKAAAVDITSHQYPFRFYLSRTLDLTERQEQLTDQRAIRFANFQGGTVLQVTGNYFA